MVHLKTRYALIERALQANHPLAWLGLAVIVKPSRDQSTRPEQQQYAK